MYTGVTVAEQLEFDSWPKAQQDLARRIFGYNETLHARYTDLDLEDPQDPNAAVLARLSNPPKRKT